MAEVVPKALILGHSFVRRLKRDLDSGFDPRAASDFNLPGTASVCSLAWRLWPRYANASG